MPVLAAKSGIEAVLLYTWMLAHADSEGRMHATPGRVWGNVVPCLPCYTPDTVAAHLDAMEALGLIQRYTDEGGDDVLQVVGHDKHQPPRSTTKEGPSEFGPPPVRGTAAEPPRDIREVPAEHPRDLRDTMESESESGSGISSLERASDARTHTRDEDQSQERTSSKPPVSPSQQPPPGGPGAPSAVSDASAAGGTSSPPSPAAPKASGSPGARAGVGGPCPPAPGAPPLAGMVPTGAGRGGGLPLHTTEALAERFGAALPGVEPELWVAVMLIAAALPVGVGSLEDPGAYLAASIVRGYQLAGETQRALGRDLLVAADGAYRERRSPLPAEYSSLSRFLQAFARRAAGDAARGGPGARDRPRHNSAPPPPPHEPHTKLTPEQKAANAARPTRLGSMVASAAAARRATT